MTAAAPLATLDQPLRLGAVPYLNGRPLVMGLDTDPRVARLDTAPPSLLARSLLAGELDAVLGSVVLLAAHPHLRLVEGPVIGCDGPVETVVVVSRGPAHQLRRVQADGASRTSNELCRLVLQRPGVEVQVGDLPQADGRVIIGDRAFAASPAGFTHRLDLGHAWKERTGLPFVFAGWLARSDELARRVGPVVREAAARGLRAREDLAEALAASCGISPSRAREYLLERIRYELTPELARGLELFLAAVRAGALPQSSS